MYKTSETDRHDIYTTIVKPKHLIMIINPSETSGDGTSCSPVASHDTFQSGPTHNILEKYEWYALGNVLIYGWTHPKYVFMQ